MKGVLREQSAASDVRVSFAEYADFPQPEFLDLSLSTLRICSRSHDDFASAGFFIRKNSLLQNVQTEYI